MSSKASQPRKRKSSESHLSLSSLTHYHGVEFNSRSGKWVVKITINSVPTILQGKYDTDKEAAVAHDKYLVDQGRSRGLNFPRQNQLRKKQKRNYNPHPQPERQSQSQQRRQQQQQKVEAQQSQQQLSNQQGIILVYRTARNPPKTLGQCIDMNLGENKLPFRECALKGLKQLSKYVGQIINKERQFFLSIIGEGQEGLDSNSWDYLQMWKWLFLDSQDPILCRLCGCAIVCFFGKCSICATQRYTFYCRDCSQELNNQQNNCLTCGYQFGVSALLEVYRLLNNQDVDDLLNTDWQFYLKNQVGQMNGQQQTNTPILSCSEQEKENKVNKQVTQNLAQLGSIDGQQQISGNVERIRIHHQEYSWTQKNYQFSQLAQTQHQKQQQQRLQQQYQFSGEGQMGRNQQFSGQWLSSSTIHQPTVLERDQEQTNKQFCNYQQEYKQISIGNQLGLGNVSQRKQLYLKLISQLPQKCLSLANESLDDPLHIVRIDCAQLDSDQSLQNLVIEIWEAGFPIVISNCLRNQSFNVKQIQKIVKQKAKSYLWADYIDKQGKVTKQVSTERFFQVYYHKYSNEHQTCYLKSDNFPTACNLLNGGKDIIKQIIQFIPRSLCNFVHPYDGMLNLACYGQPISSDSQTGDVYHVMGDLGPKIYLNAGEIKNNNGINDDYFDGDAGPITVIHTDVCDAFNLCVNVNQRDKNIQEKIACVWDIFDVDDLDKVEELLGNQIERVQHYLGKEERGQIREQGGMHWRVEQYEGDAMLVPGGCAHQVRNFTSTIKFAWDFAGCAHVDWFLQKQQRMKQLVKDQLQEKNDILQVESTIVQAALTWARALRN